MRIVRYVGEEACNNERYIAALDDESVGVIDSLTGDRNVTVQFRLNGQPMRIEPDAETRDFMDIAVSVYIADELVKRETAADRWTRDFDLVVPVAKPDNWERASSSLTSTLKFLSQDRFSFEWLERSAMPDGQRHRQSLPEGFDTVCLFSGGVDSLLGAHKLLAEGRKVLLVGHQAEPTGRPLSACDTSVSPSGGSYSGGVHQGARPRVYFLYLGRAILTKTGTSTCRVSLAVTVGHGPYAYRTANGSRHRAAGETLSIGKPCDRRLRVHGIVIRVDFFLWRPRLQRQLRPICRWLAPGRP
ncbi:MAG: hypothetical protein KDA86_27320 [Planctomycetaceae bacterium]|nr:hypothetical protein [Planctomycetaceae bacterium]